MVVEINSEHTGDLSIVSNGSRTHPMLRAPHWKTVLCRFCISCHLWPAEWKPGYPIFWKIELRPEIITANFHNFQQISKSVVQLPRYSFKHMQHMRNYFFV